MRKNVFYLLAIVVVLIGCNNKNKINQEIISQVESLITDNQKKEFLEEIHKLDQEVRRDLNEIEVEFGHDSNEGKEALQKMIKTDQVNLQKIALYLEKYGHPSIDKHGKYASGTPWIVIHHSGDIASRKKHFNYLYQAYKSDDLKPSSFSFYLGRFHRMKFGNRFTLPNPYREEQLIDSLIKRLDLQKLTQ